MDMDKSAQDNPPPVKNPVDSSRFKVMFIALVLAVFALVLLKFTFVVSGMVASTLSMCLFVLALGAPEIFNRKVGG